jgi:hypothetical protein
MMDSDDIEMDVDDMDPIQNTYYKIQKPRFKTKA